MVLSILIIFLEFIRIKGSQLPGTVLACKYHRVNGNLTDSYLTYCTHIYFSSFISLDDLISPKAGNWDKHTSRKQSSQIHNDSLKKDHDAVKIFPLIRDPGGLTKKRFGNLNKTDIRHFVENTRNMLLKCELHGIVLKLKHPRTKDYEHKITLEKLLKALKRDYKEHDLELVLMIGMEYFEFYPNNEIKDYADYIIPGTLPPWRTGAYASPYQPLFSSDGQELSTAYTLQYVMSQGVPPRKILMLLNFNGRITILQEGSRGRFGERVNRTYGITSYKKICLFIKDDNKYWHNESQTPFLLMHGGYPLTSKNGSDMVSYEDPQSVKAKVQYGKQMKIGGYFILDFLGDDSLNECGGGQYPLMTAITEELGLKRMKTEVHLSENGNSQSGPVVTCSLRGKRGYPPSYWFNYCTYLLVDSYIRLDSLIKSKFNQLHPLNDVALALDLFRKSNYTAPKILLVVESLSSNLWQDAKFHKINTTQIKNFARNSKQLLLKHKLHGLVLGWDYPATPKEKEKLVAIAKEVREEYEKYNLLVSISVSQENLERYPISQVETYINYMMPIKKTTDCAQKRGQAHSPLFSLSGRDNTFANVIQTILDQGLSPSQLIMPLSFDGRCYSLLRESEELREEVIDSRSCSYPQICSILKGSKRKWDQESKTPFLIFNEKIYGIVNYKYGIASYEDTESIAEKVKYGQQKRIAGFLISHGVDDSNNACGDGNFPLTKAIIRNLRKGRSEDLT